MTVLRCFPLVSPVASPPCLCPVTCLWSDTFTTLPLYSYLLSSRFCTVLLDRYIRDVLWSGDRSVSPDRGESSAYFATSLVRSLFAVCHTQVLYCMCLCVRMASARMLPCMDRMSEA